MDQKKNFTRQEKIQGTRNKIKLARNDINFIRIFGKLI